MKIVDSLVKKIEDSPDYGEMPSSDIPPASERIRVDLLKAALELPLYMPNWRSEVWMLKQQEIIPDNVQHFCGTIGCLAGNVVLNEIISPEMSPATNNKRVDEAGDKLHFSYQRAAARLVGLTDEESDTLFAGQTVFHATPGTRAYSRLVRAYVKSTLAGWGVKWNAKKGGGGN